MDEMERGKEDELLFFCDIWREKTRVVSLGGLL